MQSISLKITKQKDPSLLPLTVWGQCTCWHHNERNEMLQVSGTGVTTQSSCSLHNNFMEALLQVSTEGILGKRVEEGNFPHACSLFIDWRQHISPRPTAYNLCKVKDYFFTNFAYHTGKSKLTLTSYWTSDMKTKKQQLLPFTLI